MSESGKSSPPPEALLAAIEAVVFAAGEPVEPREIAAAFGGMEERQVLEALERLSRVYEERQEGLLLERVAGGFHLATRPGLGTWVRRFFRQRNRTRLTPAALETLAIVAYRQPVTAPEIQAIRGVDPSGALKSLLEKKMLRILGKKKVVGSPFLYGTTRNFLLHFGLNNLEDLPSIQQFDEFIGRLEESREPTSRQSHQEEGPEEAEPPGDE